MKGEQKITITPILSDAQKSDVIQRTKNDLPVLGLRRKAKFGQAIKFYKNNSYAGLMSSGMKYLHELKKKNANL